MHRAGVRRLLAIAFRERLRDLEKALGKDMALAPLKEDIVAAALDRTFLAESLPMQQIGLCAARDGGPQPPQPHRAGNAAPGRDASSPSRRRCKSASPRAQKAWPQAAEDVRQQLARLLQPGFLARTPWERLQHFPRYLKAAALRLDKLRADPARDAQRMAELAPLEQAWRRRARFARQAGRRAAGAELEQFGWLLEELRVSLFAQELKTPVPVSPKRLAKLWQSMRK